MSKPNNNKVKKTTVYLREEDEYHLDELFIKRMRNKNKTTRSCIMCEGLKLLFDKEIGNSDPK